MGLSWVGVLGYDMNSICVGVGLGLGATVAELVECRTQDRKVASLNPGRSCRKMFFSRVHFLC